MKRVVNLSIALFTLAAVASCSSDKSFGSMDSGFSTDATSSVSKVELSCVTEVLALTNGVVPTAICVDFPANYFDENVIAKITPALVYAAGETTSAPIYFQGSSVEDNYTVVGINGGTFIENLQFDFTDDMRISELQLRIELKNAKKETNSFYLVNANSGELLSKSEYAILAVEASEASALRKACGYTVAKGVNTLQEDFNYAALMDPMPNDYKAVTYQVNKANISYDINSSTVKSSSLSDSQMAAFKEVVKATQENESATQNVSANGYASPDGPEQLNDKLSAARSESAKKAMNNFFSEMGLEADAAAYGEDWDGFKELVQASNIQDKNLILQVLNLYSSSVQREAEIKNLASVYTELKDDILPELRRAQLISNVSIKGKSDEEMMALVASKSYEELTQEELLYLAESVIEDQETQLEVLTIVAVRYNDPRAYNNMGILLAKEGDAAGSLKSFEAATRYGASDAIINKNLVLANLDNDNYAEAKKYTADPEAEAALSAIEGNYTPATRSFEGYNAAIAHIMNNNYSAAKSSLGDCDCAKSNYLRAVIASNEGEITNGITYIKKAVDADSELAEKAKNDINLANLFEAGLTL